MPQSKTTASSSTGDKLSNIFLGRLPQEVLANLQGEMRLVDLELGQTLYELRDAVDYLYFPERGTMVSLLAGAEDGSTVEVAVVGAEGFVTLSSVLGNRLSIHRYLVQLSGPATRIKASAFRREFVQSEALRDLVNGYLYFLLAQISQTALCNRIHNVEERLARWILVTEDQADDRDLPLTHEFLARMLGVNRSTLSLTASMFQQAHYISYRRGKIKVVDREGLEGVACSCYETVKEYLDEFTKD
jgi:CRP-like cAMP-binding protein